MSSPSDLAWRLSTTNTSAPDQVERPLIPAVSRVGHQINTPTDDNTTCQLDDNPFPSSFDSSPPDPLAASIHSESKGSDHNNDLSTLNGYVDSLQMGRVHNRPATNSSPASAYQDSEYGTTCQLDDKLTKLDFIDSPRTVRAHNNLTTNSFFESYHQHRESSRPLSPSRNDVRNCIVNPSHYCITHSCGWEECLGRPQNQDSLRTILTPPFSPQTITTASGLTTDCSNISHLPLRFASTLSQRERKNALQDPKLSASVRHMYHFLGDDRVPNSPPSNLDAPASHEYASDASQGSPCHQGVSKPSNYKARRRASREEIYCLYRPTNRDPIRQESGPAQTITCCVCNVNGNGITDDSGANIWMDYAQENSVDILALIDDRTIEGNQFDRMAIKRHVRGWHVSNWTVPKGAKNENANVGGLTILVGPKLSSRVRGYFLDPTGLGIVGALLLKTLPKHVLVVASYWTTISPNTENNSLWMRIIRRLKQMGRRGETPIEYIRAECAKFIRLAQSNGWEIILMGDLNSGYDSKDGVHGDVKQWATEIGLINQPHYYALRRNLVVNTRWCNGRPTAIDHILTRSEGSRLTCTSVVDSSDLPAMVISDHLPLTVRFSFDGSITQPSYTPTVFPKIDLDLKRKEQVAAFQSSLQSLNIRRPDVIKEPSECDPSSTYPSFAAREESTWQCASFLEEVCRRSVQVLHSDAKIRSFNFKPYKGWSPQFILSTYHLSFLYKTRSVLCNVGLRKITTQQKLAEIREARDLLQARIATTDRGKKEHSIETLGVGTRPFTAWTDSSNFDRLLDWIAADIATVRKRMHARRRAEDRALINKFVRANEERRKNREYKKLLSSIFSTFRKPMDELVLENGELLVDPIQIHDRLTDYMQDWHRRNFQTKNDIDWLRALSDKTYFTSHAAFSKVPEHLRETIAESLMEHRSNQELKEQMASSLAKEITFQEFKDTVTGKASGKSPGISQFSINMLKALPEDLLLSVYRALNHLWTNRDTGISPESWKNRFLAMVPKVAESAPALDQIRPISLYETLRKVWTTIVTSRITEVWDRLRIIDRAQCGYTRGKGTHTELLQIINAIEEASELKREIFLTSYDTTKAFDSVDKRLMTAAWVRLGVPLDVAVYLDRLDTGGRTIIKTPHASSCIAQNGFDQAIYNCGEKSTIDTCSSFLAVNGIGQGDSPSATGWLAVFDILLIALRRMQDIKLFVRTSVNQLSTVDPNAFADDLNIISPTTTHAQSALDIVSAFNYVAGLTTNTGKMECGSNFDNRDLHLVVHDSQWQPHPVEIKYNKPIKVLGVQVDLRNNWTDQVSKTTEKITRILSQISRKRIANSSRHLAFTMTFLATAIYPLKFLPLTLAEYEVIRKPADNFLKRINGCKLQIPTALLYIDKKYGGLQLPDLANLIQNQKRSSLASISGSSSQDQQIGAALLQRVFRQEAVTITKYENHLEEVSSHTKAWAGSLLEEALLSPRVSLVCRNHFYDDEDNSQIPILDVVSAANRTKAQVELARCDLQMIGEISKVGVNGYRYLCQSQPTRRKPAGFTQRIAKLVDITALPQDISNHVKALRAGGFYLTSEGNIAEFVGMLDNDSCKLIFRRWQTVTASRQLKIGTKIRPMYEPEDIGVSGLTADDIVAQIYARRTTSEPGALYRVEDISYEEFRVNSTPYIFTRPRPYPPLVTPQADRLVAFTDGAYKRILNQEEILFNTITGKTPRQYAGAGAAIYAEGRLIQIIETTGISQAGIIGLNAFITEMIAILTLLIVLGDRSIYSTIYSDCKSLVKLLRLLSRPNATVNSLAAFPLCPYLNTIQRLSMYRRIEFKWIRSHAEQQRNISYKDWTLEQTGNHVANSVAAGEIEKVKKNQHSRMLIHGKNPFSDVIVELKKSSAIYFVHNGVPTGIKQLERLRKQRRFMEYLEKRTLASVDQRGFDWTEFTLALSIEIMKKCGTVTSNVTKMKVLYDKYDDDRYKPEEKKRYCPLCKVSGNDDLTDHLFNCCTSVEAQRISNLAIEKFDRTPLSYYTLQHVDAELFKRKLRLMLMSEHTCRIGRFNHSHRKALSAVMRSMTDNYVKHLHRDLVKLVGIFTAATFDLVELRNSTRASLGLAVPSALSTLEAETVWIQVPPSKRKTNKQGKKAAPVTNTIVGLWDAYKSKNSFNALADQNCDDSQEDGSQEDTNGDDPDAAFSTEEYRVHGDVTFLEIKTPGSSRLVTIQQGETIDTHIHSVNGYNLNRYLVVETEQLYTVKISPSNRPTPDGCVSSLRIPDLATVIVRPSYPPTPISPKRLTQSHKHANTLRSSCYGWREVRGDGNCYYRAIYFAVMERAIGRQEFASTLLSGIHARFEEIEDTFLATYTEQIIGHYRQLMEDLRDQRSMFDSVMDFEDYLITNPGIEIAYVCIMKSIMGKVLLTQDTTISSDQLEFIKQFYGYTDENTNTLWAEEIWMDRISPLGLDADGPLVQLHSIPTFLGVGCQLISLSETGTQGTENQLLNPLFHIAIILYGQHYDIIYYRTFGDDPAEEEIPVNQYFSHSPVYGSDRSLSSQSGDDEDPSLGYAEAPD